MSRLRKLRSVDKDEMEEKEHNRNRKNMAIGCILYGKDNKRILTTFKIPSEIPESIVLLRNKSLQSQLNALYHKYIRIGSDHELNISGTNRKHLYRIFEGEQVGAHGSNLLLKDERLINCMDFAALEILMLLQDPYNRFKSDQK